MRDLYVDNIVSSFNSEDKLSQYFKVIRTLFTDGGFNLRAWASNNKLLQQLAESAKRSRDRTGSQNIRLALEYIYDTLTYAENILDTEIDLITKREVLRKSGSSVQLPYLFWYKWKHAYLTSLREYYRNTGKDNRTIIVEDVVQVYEESPRTKWNLAVIDQLNIGGDGKTRSAVIRTKNGLTSRLITKLYPLEVLANSHFIIDNICDLTYPSSSRNLSRKAKSVAKENKWTNGNNS
ncbi:unnamed protein product [Mytilus coruscus]|uniref:DUF5641 domain-containing protein n=1 Tax=Mytilus coruscus TaxID=42192 RepID=A0A6J8CE41_MYTCO|nr:unnamed protein product [Mytilus coruscus]